jgi:hypothetical protein
MLFTEDLLPYTNCGLVKMFGKVQDVDDPKFTFETDRIWRTVTGNDLMHVAERWFHLGRVIDGIQVIF